MSEQQTEGRVAAGYYKGHAIAGSEQYGTTKSGNDQIVIDLDVPSLGRQFSTFLVFTDKSAEYELKRLRACGWDGDDISNLAGIDKNEIDVQVFYELYEGKEQMKVRIATGGGKFKIESPMDDKAKRAFAARMKSFIKGERPAAKAAPKAAAPPREQDSSTFGDTSEDEIPF
jgi:hypothetical protein